jgi:hypothetical protein
MAMLLTEGTVRGSGALGSSYPSCAMAFCTRSRVSALMAGLLLHTRETVEGETPASRATSLMVTAIAAHPFLNRIAQNGAMKNVLFHFNATLNRSQMIFPDEYRLVP